MISAEPDEEAASQLARSSDSGDGEVVERILESRDVYGVLEFLVKWVSEEHAGWEPLENLECARKLYEFYQEKPEADRCYLRFTEKRGPCKNSSNPPRTSRTQRQMAISSMAIGS